MALVLVLSLVSNSTKTEFTKNAFHVVFFNLPLVVGLLYFGGFWESMKTPQIITIILFTVNVVLAIVNHGKTVKSLGFFWSVVDFLVIVGLFKWGGFWG